MTELSERFRQTARVRLEEIVPLLDLAGHDADALQRLARHFHALAGLGGTYGYPRISELGDELEGSILPLAKRGEAPSADTIARWRTVVEEIARELC
jgi:chemotaxis protein histidine kinase CheA